MIILDLMFLFTLLSHIIFLTISVYNYFTAPKILGFPSELDESAGISILIPARNEAQNIPWLISSLEKQGLINYEIIVLDDGSTDDTYETAKKLMMGNPNISLIKGEKLPNGWLGKNWACYQLSIIAKNDLLLFIDADVRLEENAISSAIRKMEEQSASMLSVFPTQITSSLGEKLVVPLMNWLLLTFLPLKQVYISDKTAFAAANGQFIIIKREVYDKIGTHQNFKSEVVEDMEIVRKVKSLNYRAITCLGNNIISAKMYASFSESIKGFSKNFYPGFNVKRLNFYIILSLLIFLFLYPFIIVFWHSYYFYIVLLIFMERYFVSLLSKENIILNIIFHPLQILIMFIVGLRSASKKKKEWKGRLI